jgi:AraC-like DNA-binding protein
MSGDPEQEYFADGMVEEIITVLSRFRQLFVIARNSSFTYKDRAVDVKQVGRELGVRYVLEGSVRKAGNRVATHLGLSERTLARRLSDLDASFAEIVDSLRHELALRYLNEPNLSFTQLSFLLGYAGPSAFTHACRRWTGKTPREMRRG